MSVMVVITILWELFYQVLGGIVHTGETTLTTNTTHFQQHMYYNNQNSWTVLIQAKATCITSVQRIVLQTNTIDAWKCVGLLTGFWIKKKFQDTSVHHYVTNPDSGVLEPLLAPQRKYYILLRLCGRSQVKTPLHVQMRDIYSQGWHWPLWFFDFPHDCLTYMTLQLYIWVSWTSMLHYTDYNIMAHINDVAEMTHDMTQHDSAGMFMLMVVSMSSCS